MGCTHTFWGKNDLQLVKVDFFYTAAEPNDLQLMLGSFRLFGVHTDVLGKNNVELFLDYYKK